MKSGTPFVVANLEGSDEMALAEFRPVGKPYYRRSVITIQSRSQSRRAFAAAVPHHSPR